MRVWNGPAVRVIRDPALFYDDNCLITAKDAQTFVDVPLVPTGFLDHMDRYALGKRTLLALAPHTGPMSIKVAHRPHNADHWRRATEDWAHKVGDPSPFLGEWLDMRKVAAEQHQRTEKHVVMGFRLGIRSPLDVARWKLAEGQGRAARMLRAAPDLPGQIAREADKWATRADAVRGRLARSGLHARPVDAAELRYWRLQSLHRGNPFPADPSGRDSWLPGEIADEFAEIALSPMATGPTTHGVRIDTPAGTRYTTTLVAATFPRVTHFPVDSVAWLAHLDSIAEWVEADVLLDLVPPAKAKALVEFRNRIARDQRREIAKAGEIDVPIELGEMLDLAQLMEYEIPARQLPMAVGWVRVRVDADSPEELDYRRAIVVERMSDESSPRIGLRCPSGMTQVDLVAEAVPGSPPRSKHYQQRLLLETVACGLPQSGSGLTATPGIYLGPTTGGAVEAVSVNLHAAITREPGDDKHVEKPGGVLILGEVGSGKSGDMATFADAFTTIGIEGALVDFSDQLSRLAAMERHRGRIAVHNLVKNLGPVLDPMTDAVYPGDVKNDRRVRQARWNLTRDVFATMAEPHLSAFPAATDELLQAIQAETWQSDRPTSAGVLERLRRGNDVARSLFRFLEFTPLSLGTDSAMVNMTGEDTTDTPLRAPVLDLYTATGMELPEPGRMPRDYTPGMREAVALFTACSAKCHQLLFDKDRHTLKWFGMDEMHVGLSTDSGRRVLQWFYRDFRKHGGVAIGATHHGLDVAEHSWLVGNLGWRFQFRSTSPAELAFTLPNIDRIEDTPDNRFNVATFDNGECLVVDYRNVRDRLRIDHACDPDLAATAGTTPRGTR